MQSPARWRRSLGPLSHTFSATGFVVPRLRLPGDIIRQVALLCDLTSNRSYEVGNTNRTDDESGRQKIT
jgi:hypothetical protein